MKVLAAIPTRIGSKRIHKKNLAPMPGGHTLMAYAIMFAHGLNENTNHDVDVVTIVDDVELADEADKYESMVFYSKHGESNVALAWSAVTQYRAMRGDIYDATILLEPTSPLRITSDVERCLLSVQGGAGEAFTVSPVPHHYRPGNHFTINAGRALRQHSDGRQTYHLNGCCYAQSLRDGRQIELWTPGAVPVVIERTVVNIDEEADLVYARHLMS